MLCMGLFYLGVSVIAGYGLADARQIKHFAQVVVDVLGGGENAYRLLVETAAAETGYGTIPDRTRHGAGRGLFQCDEIGFVDVVKRARDEDVLALDRAFDFDLRRIKFELLNYSPLVAAAVARLHYKLRPGAIPATLRGRGEYWKKHYNSVLGKGSVDDYIFRAQRYEAFY